MAGVDFQVDRTDLRKSRFQGESAAELADGHIRFVVERFALTANNITYGVAGDLIGYWNFFPAEEGWGRIPVWGIARVEASRVAGVSVGDRYFGYLPMSTHLDIKGAELTNHSIVDGAAHRAALPPIYNRYECLPEASESEDEAWMMLLRVLFLTGWLIDDFLSDHEFFGSEAVVILSASSKTAFSLAHCLAARPQGRPQVIGLTSPGNLAFTTALGCYDRVLTYDQVAELDAAGPTTLVDMSGNGKVGAALHRHFADALQYHCQVGLTHWEEQGSEADLPGATPEFFFAPTQVEKRLAEWGAAGLAARQKAAWEAFLKPCRGWLHLAESSGEAAVAAAYHQMLEGRIDPSLGVILALPAEVA